MTCVVRESQSWQNTVSVREVCHRLVYRHTAQQPEIAEHLARAEHDRRQRIIRDRNWQAGLFADALVEILKQRAAAGKHDAAVADIGRKFRWRPLERDAAGVEDGR